MATAVKTKTQELKNDEQLAADYASVLVYNALLEAGEPTKANEVVRLIGRADIDTRLARVILTTNPQMTAVDRKWTLWNRYIDAQRSTDFNMRRILDTFMQPIPLQLLAREMESVYGRPAVIFEEILSHLTSDPTQYFKVGAASVAPNAWLLDTEVDNYIDVEDEVLFDNFLRDEDVFPYEKTAVKVGLNQNSAESIAAFLDAVDVPIRGRAVQFLAWRIDRENFNAAHFYNLFYNESGAIGLSDGTWIGPKMIARLTSLFPALAEQEVSDNAEDKEQESAQPLTVGQEDIDTLVQIVCANEGSTYASKLIEDVFDVLPDYRTYAVDLQTIISALAEDERIVWLGSDRFRPHDALPSYVFSVPGLLEIPVHVFFDVEGNPLDQLLEDEGFDGGLDREIMNPLSQDVIDEEPIPLPDPNPPSNARAVIKYHHKQIGTLPLCQFPHGFFPPVPNILETEFIIPGGHKVQVWINNEARLMYGLLDWFESIPIDSGATFTLERQAPDRYIINYNDESEPSMFISRNRVNELLALQERAEEEELSTYDIIREIMEHYRKGIEFLTLLTEVNIVRRVTRQMVASILSEYHCFFQRAGAWVYDAKKLTLGFDKSKRKYLVK